MKHKRRENNVLLHFLYMPFIVLLVLMVVACMVIYSHSYRSAMHTTLKNHDMTLQSAAHQLDGEFRVIASHITAITDNASILKDIRMAKLFPSYYGMEIIHSLSKIQLPSGIVDSYLLYASETGYIYMVNSGFLNPALYYGSCLGVEGMDYDQWKEETLDASLGALLLPARNVYVAGKCFPAITYIHPFANSDRGRIKSKLLYYLSTDRIADIFAPVFELGASYVFLTDSAGNLLVRFGTDSECKTALDMAALPVGSEKRIERTINGTRMVMSSASFSDTIGNIFIATPRGTIVREALGMLVIPLVTLLTALAASTIMVASFLHTLRKPLSSLSYGLDVSDGHKPFHQLGQAVKQMRDDNHLLNRQLSLHKEALYESIVSDQRGRGSQLFNLLSDEIGMDGRALMFIGSYMRLSDTPKAGTEEVYQRIFRQYSTEACSIRMISRHMERTYAVLCMIEEEPDPCALEDLFQKISMEFTRCFGAKVLFALGLPRRSLDQVCYSFSEAWDLLAPQIASGERSVVLAEPALKNRYLLSVAEENALRASLLEGEADRANALVEALFRKNFVECDALSRVMQTFLYVRLLDLLMNCSDGECFDVDLYRLQELQPNEAWEAFLRSFRLCAEMNARKKVADSSRLSAQIVDYIHQNFRDPDICLTSIASAFGMTESYLSTLLKHALGQTYSSYLENLRIQQANEMLRDGRYNINDIALMVGYNNVTSFRRAYKRIMGFTPTLYQNQWKTQNQEAKNDV